MMVHATCDVIATLQMTLHPDESIRKEGESRLEACSRLDGFGISLLQVSVNTDAQTGLRQLALVVLKRLVRDRWTVSAEAEERCICDEEKAQIRAMLPTGLGDAASQVQTATGLVVAEIMKAESFEEWPELMPGLIGVIQQNQDHHVVKGALRAICIMIEDFDQMHVLQLAQQVLPRITQLCKSPQASWIEKRQSLTIIHATIDTVECVYRSMPEVKGFLKENIVSWLEASLSVLDQPLSEEVQDAWGAVFTALQCLTRIIPLSSQLDNMSRLMQVLSVVWKLNSTLMGLYQRFVLGDDILESQASADEPLMEAVSLQDLVSQYLELLMTIVSYPKLKKVCEPSLHDISELAIGYMIIGNEEIDEWMTDCNAFISSTDDFWGPRSSGGMLLDTIVEAYGTKGGIAVASALQNRMGQGEAACLARDPMYWRHIEASVLALGDISDRILEGRLKKEIVSDQNSLLNPNAMIRILLSNSAYNSTSTPLLLARIFWIAGTFSRVLNREIRQLVFSKISEAIESPQLQPPVYGGIFQALSSLIRYSETEDIEQISQRMMHYLCEMLANATEETLHLMLETISALIEKCPSAVQSADRIIPIIMRAWIDNFNDPLVGEDAFDLLKRVSMAQGGSAAMMKLAVPTIQSILEAPSAAPLLVSGAIDLIVTLACSGSLLESKGILEVFYPCCMHLLQTSSDEDVIASSSAFLRTILQLGGKEALVWLSPNPEETVNSYIQIVHYLLNQDISDRASRYVGGIVMSLIQATSLEQLVRALTCFAVIRYFQIHNCVLFCLTLVFFFSDFRGSIYLELSSPWHSGFLQLNIHQQSNQCLA